MSSRVGVGVKTADYIRGIMKPDIDDYRKFFYQMTITNIYKKSKIVEKGPGQ